MAKLNTKEIKTMARELIARSPGGIRYGEIVSSILKSNPETSSNTINGCVWNLQDQFPKEITKPSRGLFMPMAVSQDNVAQTETPASKISESDFYEPFAEWLKTELDEVTDVIAIGGAVFQKKWGTPDVVGVYKPIASNLIKFQPEIVSAEIKTDAAESVVAFGQAMAYRLFSTKTYIVMPSTITEEDKSRLEALCMLFGTGLVLFKINIKNPDFEIRVRAQRFSPDLFYVNEFADRLRQSNVNKFNHLFT